jgi:hypothetical protein
LLTLKQETPGTVFLGQQKQLDMATARVRSGELATPGDWKLPKDWSAEGDNRFYRIGVDEMTAYNWQHSLFVSSIKEGGDKPATIFQTFSAKSYLGKRVRFSAMVQTDRTEYAMLGVRTYSLSDEFQPILRLIKGTTPWTLQQVVLDVPQDAELISIVVMQTGPGTTWANAFDFRVVDRSVPLTDSIVDFKSPRNLDFSK